MKRAILLLVFCASCQAEQPSAMLQSAPDSLLDTGLYESTDPNEIADGVLAYTPNYPLWSDGLQKQRWLYLPEGSVIVAEDPDRWVFPLGTKIWKEFSFEGRIETRLMEKIEDYDDIDGWEFTSYVWNEEQTDALKVSSSGLESVATTPFDTLHDIPSRANCETCHNRGGDAVLGIDLVQLSGEGAGLRLNTLRQGEQISPATIEDEFIPANSEAEQEMFGYLHSNCGNCHNPDARAGRQSPLMTRYNAGALTAEDLAVVQTSVGVLTERYEVPGRRLYEDSYQIEAGVPEFSAVFIRSDSREEEIAMPPLGTKVIDINFVNTLHRWIENLEGRDTK